MVEVLQFTVKMDHVILADIGQGYTISRGQRRFHRGPNDTANPSGVPPAKSPAAFRRPIPAAFRQPIPAALKKPSPATPETSW